MCIEEVKTFVPLAISAASLFVSISSWLISFYNYRRDNGLLDVDIGVYHILGGTRLKHESTMIGVRIVNAGRRPVFLTGVGFEHRGNWWKKPLSRIFPKIQPSGAGLYGEKLHPLIFDNNGQFKILQEGQTSSTNLPYDERGTSDEWKKMLEKAKSFYITDTIGRRHRASCRTFRKLKRDVIKNQLVSPLAGSVT